MCGRINLTAPPHVLAERFYLDVAPDLRPRWNIAPTQDVAAVVPNPLGEGRLLRMFRWGLVPPWSPEPDTGAKMINARSETVREKPAFRDAFARRRCLVPVNGFYEWQKRGDGKQPFLFRRRDHDVFALAGIWERWEYPGGRTLETCSILTTAANAVMRPVHHRMPVVVPEADWRLWFSLDEAQQEAVMSLLQPAPTDLLIAHPVSRRVNSPSCDEPACVEPVDDDRTGQMNLFG
ncbi:MAG TPA: SOS response-associated peptidase [Candidatus Krumholzibacteria bacterium]|nr:SOS response-associated peptidase [Candidatus Krumholzibacteria bacterium]